MLRSASVSLTVAVLGCGIAAGMCGCHLDQCSETLTCGDSLGPPARVCHADPASGAAENDCGVFVSASLGDDAGPGNVNAGGSGLDGQPAPDPNPMGFGEGGSGETSGLQCIDGALGLNGEDGAHGDGATGPGRITAENGWQGKRGEDGGNGRPGQGGGGGVARAGARSTAA